MGTSRLESIGKKMDLNEPPPECQIRTSPYCQYFVDFIAGGIRYLLIRIHILNSSAFPLESCVFFFTVSTVALNKTNLVIFSIHFIILISTTEYLRICK